MIAVPASPLVQATFTYSTIYELCVDTMYKNRSENREPAKQRHELKLVINGYSPKPSKALLVTSFPLTT